jgi:D-3-phosphoglycerate dehydrogenase
MNILPEKIFPKALACVKRAFAMQVMLCYISTDLGPISVGNSPADDSSQLGKNDAASSCRCFSASFLFEDARFDDIYKNAGIQYPAQQGIAIHRSSTRKPVMKIAILDDYQNAVRSLECFSKLAGHDITVWTDHTKNVDTLAARLAETEILILLRERTPITAQLLERLPNLKLISQHGVTPHIDVDACTRLGIVVSSGQYARPSYATAEFAWGLVISAMRHIPQEVERFKKGAWQSTLGLALHGRTLGVFGYGRIGALLAGYGKAFGMRVLVWGRESTQGKARADGVQVAASKKAFFEQSDVVSLHIRLTDSTHGIVTADDLALMKPTALIVNTSRAALIEPGALEQALRAGRPGMAAVDVYEEEPVLGAAHPLLALDNVVCTPHLGYVERDSYEFGFGKAFDQVIAFTNGAPVHVVNPEVLAGNRQQSGSSDRR